MNGIEIIQQERERQISKEGWTPEHDDQHTAGELAQAASCYALAAAYDAEGWDPRRVIDVHSWPWAYEWWKPGGGPIRNLAKAGALIAAEIDRLQRKAALDGEVR
jgi:hypothetical protein